VGSGVGTSWIGDKQCSRIGTSRLITLMFWAWPLQDPGAPAWSCPGEVEASADVSGVVIRNAGGRMLRDNAELRGELGVESGVGTTKPGTQDVKLTI